MTVLQTVSSGSATTISAIQAAHDAGTKTAWQSREWTLANDFAAFAAQKSAIDTILQQVITDAREISQTNFDNAVQSAKDNYDAEVAILLNNISTTKNTLDIDGTQDISDKLAALQTA